MTTNRNLSNDEGNRPRRVCRVSTILANERTFDNWMRTSLGCVAIGAGLQALFLSLESADSRLGVKHLLDGADQRLRWFALSQVWVTPII